MYFGQIIVVLQSWHGMCALLKHFDCMTMSIDSAKQVTCSNKTEFLHERYHAVWCFTISMLSVSWQEMELWTSSCLNGSNGDSCQSHNNSCSASSAFRWHQQFSTCLELDLEAWADFDVPFQQHPQLAEVLPRSKICSKKYLPAFTLVFVLASQARRQPCFLACRQLSDRTGISTRFFVEWKMPFHHSWL